MKLVTYQSKEALERIKKEGYLIMEEDKYPYTQIKRFENPYGSNFPFAYNFIIDRMNKRLVKPDEHCFYPLWAWYKVNGRYNPSKHMDRIHHGLYRITFNIDEKDVLLSDFDMFCYILSGGLYFKKPGEEELDVIHIKDDTFFYDNLDQMFEINKKKDDEYSFSCRRTTIQATFWKLNKKDIIEIRKV